MITTIFKASKPTSSGTVEKSQSDTKWMPEDDANMESATSSDEDNNSEHSVNDGIQQSKLRNNKTTSKANQPKPTKTIVQKNTPSKFHDLN